jgi:hypothetical protein
MLRQVITIEEKPPHRRIQALQALLVQVRELELVPTDPVEDAKLHWR